MSPISLLGFALAAVTLVGAYPAPQHHSHHHYHHHQQHTRPFFHYPLEPLNRWPDERVAVQRAIDMLNANTFTGVPVDPVEGKELYYQLHTTRVLSAGVYLKDSAMEKYLQLVQDALQMAVGEESVRREEAQWAIQGRPPHEPELQAVFDLVPLRVRGFVLFEWGGSLRDLNTPEGYLHAMQYSYHDVGVYFLIF